MALFFLRYKLINVFKILFEIQNHIKQKKPPKKETPNALNH